MTDADDFDSGSTSLPTDLISSHLDRPTGHPPNTVLHRRLVRYLSHLVTGLSFYFHSFSLSVYFSLSLSLFLYRHDSASLSLCFLLQLLFLLFVITLVTIESNYCNSISLSFSASNVCTLTAHTITTYLHTCIYTHRYIHAAHTPTPIHTHTPTPKVIDTVCYFIDV